MQLRSRIPFILVLILGSAGAFSVSAQWTGPSGAPPTGSPSSFISGAGSAGRVTYWDGPSSVTSDPNFVWDVTNTRLGIGTAAPGQRLTVSSGGDVYLRVEKPSFPDQLDIGIATHQARIGYTTTPATNADINFLTNGASRMFIRDDGNIGIGTTGPGDKLHIRGGGAIIENTADPRLRFRTDANNEWYVWDDTSAAGILRFAGKKAGVWNWQVLVLDKGGNVGIGDTTPTYKLDVAGTGRFTGLLTVPTPSVAANAANKGYVDTAVAGISQNLFETINAPSGTDPVADSVTDTLNLATSGSLSITGNSTTDTITLNASINSCAAGSSIRVINANGTVSCETDDTGGVSGGAANKVAYWTGASTLSNDSLFHWDATNNRLGIGTTNPTSKLHVKSGNITIENTTDPRLRIVTDANNEWRAWDDTSAAGILRFGAKNAGVWNWQVLVLDKGGNVGIGTTNPTSKLHVAGDINVSGNDVGNADFFASGFDTDKTNAAPWYGMGRSNLTLSGAGSTSVQLAGFYGVNLKTTSGDLVLNQQGNVGIGTTSPGAKLQVNGGVGIGTGLSGNFTSGSVLAIGDSDTGFKQQGDGQLAIYTNNAERVRITNAGLVGIGTTNPGAKFEVSNTSILGSTAGSRLSITRIRGAAGNSIFLRTDLYRASAGSDWTTAALLLQRQTDSTTQAFISFYGSKIGIGKTNPSAELEVNGWYGRTLHYNGGLVGSYNNVGANSLNTNPIYIIGSAYKPANTTLSNMYGIGYTHTNSSFVSGGSGWGMYVAAGGAAPIFLNGNSGGVYANAFYYNSDSSLKKDMKPIDSALDKILQLDGISYRWKATDRPDIGFTAQNVEKVFPELVSTSDGKGLKSLDYGHLTAPIVEAIKEQQAQIKEQQKRIVAQQGQATTQQEQIASQQAQIDVLQATVAELIRLDGDYAPSASGDAALSDATVSNMQLNYDEGAELKSGLLSNAWSALVGIFANE